MPVVRRRTAPAGRGRDRGSGVPTGPLVIRHVRPEFSRRRCKASTQSVMQDLPVDRGWPGSGLLAHVLVSKDAVHQPLYRQSEIYAREGVALELSTLADWVGRSGAILEPLVNLLREGVMAAARLHARACPRADRTGEKPVPELGPVIPVDCWVHVRRKVNDVDAARQGPGGTKKEGGSQGKEEVR